MAMKRPLCCRQSMAISSLAVRRHGQSETFSQAALCGVGNIILPRDPLSLAVCASGNLSRTTMSASMRTVMLKAYSDEEALVRPSHCFVNAYASHLLNVAALILPSYQLPDPA